MPPRTEIRWLLLPTCSEWMIDDDGEWKVKYSILGSGKATDVVSSLRTLDHQLLLEKVWSIASIPAHTETGSCMTAALLRSPALLRRHAAIAGARHSERAGHVQRPHHPMSSLDCDGSLRSILRAFATSDFIPDQACQGSPCFPTRCIS
jgi:hypothetical protein